MSHYAVINPTDNQLVAAYDAESSEALDAKLVTAVQAQQNWASVTTVEQRAELLHKVADVHLKRRQELAEIITQEMGKPINQALGEIDFCIDIYNYNAEVATECLADVVLSPSSGRAIVRSAPIGVLLGVMPWNYPAYQVARFAAPNLAIGNAIVLKHASQCPRTAAVLEEIFVEAGFPAGLYSNIYASNQQIADMIADPRIAGVSVTGSERAGQAIAEVAGRNLKKVVMELGGADPFVVLSTNDMENIVEQAVAARLDNTGQACNAAKRFIIVDELYDDFVEKLVPAFTGLSTGDPTSEDTYLGPLSSESATDTLQRQVETAVANGATLHGNMQRDGNFVRPVVLTEVRSDNPAYYEEFFGPVAIVKRAMDESDAIRLANDTPFGLGSYIFSEDEEQAMRVADKLQVGMAFINVVGAEEACLSFGGVKKSGIGRELGTFGFQEFVNKKMIRIE